MSDPSGYLPDKGLRQAVNVALLLHQPLLLAGEPGVGKTQLAYSLAYELGFEQPLKFETKSTSSSKDLFYTFDTLRCFQAAQRGNSPIRNADYLTYNALGLAILQANEYSAIRQWVGPGYSHNGPRQSVVLVDEIDKAPRDFPNDILNELELMYFRLPELENVRIGLGAERFRPIVVITSNSEKHLPDAFLRRCVFYSIPFPDEERLRQIVVSRIGAFAGNSSRLLSDALDFFYRLRAPNSRLHKKPATAELLGWLNALLEMEKDTRTRLRRRPDLMQSALGALLKAPEDQEQAQILLQGWMEKR